MGDHYIPQFYLKGFTEDNRNIWVYEKALARKFCSSVKNVAHETGYYSPEVEKYLANDIESPANPVIDKIRRQENISHNEKVLLSRYMSVLLRRVPQSKEMLKQVAPRIHQGLMNQLDSKIDQWIEMNPQDSEKREHLWEKAIEVYNSSLVEPSKEMWLQMIQEERFQKVADAMSQMAWRYITFDGSPTFLTGDNPLYFNRSLGIGKANSEIIFPISSNIVLFMTWRMNEIPLGYIPIRQKQRQAIVKWINQQTILNATRYVYHARDEKWLPKFIKKTLR